MTIRDLKNEIVIPALFKYFTEGERLPRDESEENTE
jgi:hypothetical protein